MAKYITLSFDDARVDTYDVVLPIIKRNALKATLNVVTDFIINSKEYKDTFKEDSMTISDLTEWENCGCEIACHGFSHKNTVEDVKKGIRDLKMWGFDTAKIGFASPGSFLTPSNICSTGIEKLYLDDELAYIRSGIQVKREGLRYTILYVLEQKIHSAKLFKVLNKRNIITNLGENKILPSITITNETRVSQIINFIEAMPDNAYAILMFHSVKQGCLKHDKWSWNATDFETLCNYLSESNEIEVLTTKEYIGGIKNVGTV